MKPATFAYSAPDTVDEAVALLAEHGDDASILAGGQSLVPAMSLRLARPAVLIDINRARGPAPLRVEPDRLAIGLRARHAQVEAVAVGGATGRLLATAGAHIGHPPIRSRGTFCGSLAYADPAAEWCVVAVALDAVAVLRSLSGERVVPATELVEGPLSTSRRPDELLVEASVPRLGPAWRSGFCELSRRAGDFAVALAAVAVELGDDGRVNGARIALGGVEGAPRRLADAEAALRGETVHAAVDAVAVAAADAVEPFGDLHAPAAYRRHAAEVLVRRALQMAVSTADGVNAGGMWARGG